MPIWGKLSDAFGRRRFFVLGMVIFVIGSALCGMSQSMLQLVAFRAVQGLGAGAMLPINGAIIGDIFPPATRAKWQGVLFSVHGFATIVGPLLGGWITDTIGWRWTFYVNLPVGAISVAFALMALPAHVKRRKHSIDYMGTVLLIVASMALLLGFSWAGSEYAWRSPVVLGLLDLLGGRLGGLRAVGGEGGGADRQSQAVQEPVVHHLGLGGLPADGGAVRAGDLPAAVRPGRHGEERHQFRHRAHAHDADPRGHQHRRRLADLALGPLQGHGRLGIRARPRPERSCSRA